MAEAGNKVMTAKEAISRFVHDGDHLVIGNYTVGTCAELVFETVRQRKKGLTLYSQSGVFDVEVLVAGGCVDKLVTTYVYRAGGKEGGSAVERALKAGTLQMEDYTNFQYNARLVAGMHGFTFMQVLEGAMVTDLFKKRTFMGEDKYRVITCPYTGKQVLTVPAANPDVCIVHVQRSDKFGNAQYWGALGSVAAAALASKRIIVSCEEIVDHDIIKSSPHLTLIPAYRVDAVVEVPWGAHPTEVLGYYNLDRMAYAFFFLSDMTGDGLKAWMDEWVYGCCDRQAYMDHYMAKHGSHMLDIIRAKAYYSAPANYGAAYGSCWDNEGRERTMGLTIEEIEKVLEERGLLYG
ncbi:MAG: 3-oxoadipate CoA-transferase subunit A [Deltaproteobacteria bacterium ADurb.BinA179]|jgi:glutaconate CoA-transferase subunit A|nr:CoA transferase subunit A [Deltaproteobacteria bacterium]MDI9542350.1 CoA-transferase [Pseudomonadota bacterium]OPZ29124.1 MAG: 3-oxoadipate CoA-transferase subunit A [Deltaproteobacteria bacterium ADurb.BinA179]HRR21676.1 CoA-transferase [Desulfomonilia bacterium]HOD70460.1 CoA-transferase [Deltaproteobacteria bacterium]